MRKLAMGLMGLLVGVPGVWAMCPGDCNGDGAVAVNELVTGVNIALDNAPVAQCAAFDSNADARVAVSELVGAVASLLNGCPFTGQYSARLDVGDGETAVLLLQTSGDGRATATLGVVAATAPERAGLHMEIPLLTLTGTVDLDSGAYHLTGSAQGSGGDVPIDVSGVLPASPGGSGTVDLTIGSESFSGSIISGSGLPTPTPTHSAASPTPTATAMPAGYPTPGASCLNGSFSLAFSAVDGTNSYVDLGPGLGIGKGTFNFNPAVFGAQAVPCTLGEGEVVRRVQLIYIGAVTSGASIPLGQSRGQGTFDYIETPTSNPLGTRGWRASSGTLVVDALDEGTVRFHITGALMTPEPSFSAQTPAAGTFVIDAGAQGTL
ncbi:MAG: hypothetical protein ABI629_23775 [bacterium]